MNFENPLLTGTDLESLRFQANMLRGVSNQLAIESISNDKAMNPFLGFVSRVKTFAIGKLSILPSFKDIDYKPNYNTHKRIEKLNYGLVRSALITSIPDSNAKIHDYLEYLDGVRLIVDNTITQTIPGCKQYFSSLLEDVSALSSSAQSSAVARLSNNQFALENLNKRFPGIIKRQDDNYAKVAMSMQYDSIKDFLVCQDFLSDITKKSASIKVEMVSRDVKDLNEIISRVIMVVKQKKDITVDPEAVAAVSGYLYQLAEEIALIPAYATHLEMAIKTLGSQLTELDQYSTT